MCEYEIELEDFGLVMVFSCNLWVESVVELCVMLEEVLYGKYGVVYDIVCFNVGVVLYIVDVVDSIDDGIMLVWVIIVSGVVCVKMV